MKKRIAILATFVGTINRGAETFVIELTRRLRQQFDVTVFSKGIAEDIIENIVKINFKLPFWFNTHKNLYRKSKIFRRFCIKTYYLIPDEIEQYFFSKSVFNNYLKSGNFDLIYPNNGIWGVRAASKIRKLKGTPFICTGHGGNSVGEIKILKQKPDKYIAQTEKYKNWSSKFFRKVTKIHVGVNIINNFKNIEIKSEHKNLKKPVILCVAEFNEMKRQKLLVDAISCLENGFLIMLGKGELKDYLKKYCESKIKGRYIIDEVPYNEVFYYYQLCDLFSLPSKDEPFGIVYLEAMNANKPVVTTDDETRREIINDAGILVNVENPVLYSDALKECYEKDWGNIPSERVKNNFSWDKISQEYTDLIREVI